MKKFLFIFIMIFIIIGFAIADDHINPFTGEESLYNKICRVYDIDNDGVIDGSDLKVEEFTLMYIRFQKYVDLEIPDDPGYGPRKYRK